MESTHFYFAMIVSLVLVALGLAVATTATVGYSLVGLGCAVAGLAIGNRYLAGAPEGKPVPVRAEPPRTPIIYQ
ncbi:MAG: hypothetical protein AB8C02_07240 [Halioglobus sp.]